MSLVSPHHAAAFRRELPGIVVTVLPALPYAVNYASDHHVIGFTFERQDGMHAFASDRRRPFFAEPWRLAFTPAGCEVFSTSERGGEYLVIAVRPDVFARLTPAAALRQFTNSPAPWFTPLAAALRRTVCASTSDDIEIEILAAQAVACVAARSDERAMASGLASAMTARRMKRILEYIEAYFDRDVRLADLARQVDLSEAYLARVFKAATGMTLHAALVERRVALARRLMSDEGGDRERKNLAAIAAQAGFSSHAHMATAFQRMLGTSPSRWTREVTRRVVVQASLEAARSPR